MVDHWRILSFHYRPHPFGDRLAIAATENMRPAYGQEAKNFMA
jgi:hypothetical protein